MTTRRSLLTVASAVALAVQANAAVYLSPNLLADPGFESGTAVPSSTGGWSTLSGAAFSQDYALSGQWSMKSPYNVTGLHAPSFQQVPATAGVDYTLTGWGYTPTALVSGQRGFMIMFFTDVNGTVLGQFEIAPTIIDETSPVNTWLPLSITLTAPGGTAMVWAEVGLFNFNSAAPLANLYFDDMNLVAVPEPSALALLSFGFIGRVWSRRARS